jgi:sarcosine oxidase delta subunit
MAISCPLCGKKLSDTTIFCLGCGVLLHDTAQSAAPAERPWEYCEVVYTVEPRGSSRESWFAKTYYFTVVF